MKFDISFSFNESGDFLVFTETNFPSCNTNEDVREFLNNSKKFISIADNLINLERVSHIHIVKTKDPQ
jgi:hypothetical protein